MNKIIEELEGDENTERKVILEKTGGKEYQLLYFYEKKKKIWEEIIEYLENYETAINQPEIERHTKNWTFEIFLVIIIFLLICLAKR